MIASVALVLAAMIGQNDQQTFIEHSCIFNSINHQTNERIAGGNLFKIRLRSVSVGMAC